VLTVAHCFKRNGVAPDVVRLGAHNLNLKTPELNSQQFKIQEFIKHEKYRHNFYYNDIALIKLDGIVKFTKSIRPACLWQTLRIKQTTATVAGFGSRQSGEAPQLQLEKVTLDIIDQKTCQRFNPKNMKIPDGIIDSHLCAGKLAGQLDTCKGDSGSALTVTIDKDPCTFYVIGVTSFGSVYCGAPNAPSVYTRISSFVDWIEEKVWGMAN
jgi:secreted trypsin-like serine protease